MPSLISSCGILCCTLWTDELKPCLMKDLVCVGAHGSRKWSLSTEGPDWQVLKASGWQAGGGSPTLAGQKMDEWGWAAKLMDIIMAMMATSVFCGALFCYGISALVP
jgi:hypothetical protein